MVNLKIHEDRPTPKEVYNWRVWLMACCAAFATFTYGYDGAFIGGTLALPSFISAFGINASNSSYLSTNIVTVYQAGAFWGSLFAFPIADKLGRKITILSSGVIFCVGCAIQLAAHSYDTLTALYIGRVVAGIAIGFISLSVPIYISEIAPPAIRGRLVALYEIFLQLGAVLGFWINYGVNTTMAPSTTQWRIPIALQLVPGGLVLVLAFFLVESPRWLRATHQDQKAVESLCWLRKLDSQHTYILEELAMIDEQIQMQGLKNRSIWSQLKEVATLAYGYRMAMCVCLAIFQNLTGINAINYYSPTVFKQLGIVGTNTGLLSTGIFGIVKCSATVVWCFFLVDNVGRRPLLLFGSAGSTICMVSIVGLLQSDTAVPGGPITSRSIGAAAFLYIFSAVYGPTWNGTPWVITAEVFPTHIRSICVAIYAAFGNWLWTFVISRATPYMFTSMKNYVFLFFGIGSFIGFIFVWFIVPETKGVPIEDMDKIFGRGRFTNTAGSDVERPHHDEADQKQSDHSSFDETDKATTTRVA